MRTTAPRLMSSAWSHELVGHARERLVARDAGVVHDDVDAAVRAQQMLGDALRARRGGHVGEQRRCRRSPRDLR